MPDDPRTDLLRLQPYLQDFALAALAEEEDTALLCAIALRETWAGWSPGYVLPYPGAPRWLGRGDNGHGYDFFQIDDRGPYAYLPREAPEASPELQARWACWVLRDNRVALAVLRGHPLWERAVICAYNNGGPKVGGRNTYEAVRHALQIGVNPDLVTTGQDYGSDVQRRRDKLRREHPEVFPPPHNQQPTGGIA
jgi:hypothetical protein